MNFEIWLADQVAGWNTIELFSAVHPIKRKKKNKKQKTQRCRLAVRKKRRAGPENGRAQGGETSQMLSDGPNSANRLRCADRDSLQMPFITDVTWRSTFRATGDRYFKENLNVLKIKWMKLYSISILMICKWVEWIIFKKLIF